MCFYCSTATLVNQNSILYINMKQDTDKLKVQVGDVRVCGGGGGSSCPSAVLSLIMEGFLDDRKLSLTR